MRFTALKYSVAGRIARITLHSPEGAWFKNYAEKHGFHAAVKWRDSGKAIP